MGQEYSVVAEQVTAKNSLSLPTTATMTVASGGSISVASGGVLTLTSGANLAGTVNIPSGASLSLASGASMTLASGANAILPSAMIGAPGTASVSVATASGTTVPIAQGIVRVSGTAATTSGSCTLAAGGLDGQIVTIVNEGAVNFVVTGNMKANQTLAASSAMQCVWVSTDTQWWRCN